jgi:hypothetical protein
MARAGDRTDVDPALLRAFLVAPQFMPVDPTHRPAVLAVVDDTRGRPRAFVDMAAVLPNLTFVCGRSARVEPAGPGVLSIAIRAEQGDIDPAQWRLVPGDSPVLRRREWVAAHPGRLHEPWLSSGRCKLAVELPHRAAGYVLADR